jgi:hypothetical protein
MDAGAAEHARGKGRFAESRGQHPNRRRVSGSSQQPRSDVHLPPVSHRRRVRGGCSDSVIDSRPGLRFRGPDMDSEVVSPCLFSPFVCLLIYQFWVHIIRCLQKVGFSHFVLLEVYMDVIGASQGKADDRRLQLLSAATHLALEWTKVSSG